MTESRSFDRVADCFDQTRGGLPRGRVVADALDEHLAAGDRVLEIGIGTGVVAKAFAERGRPVVGLDLAPAMLAQARRRLGPVVVLGDAHAMPLPTAAVDDVVAAWILHLVADPAGVVRECARVLRPGGRLLVIGGHPVDHDEIAPFWEALKPLRRPDTLDDMRGWTTAADLVELATGRVAIHFDQSPAEYADFLERRVWSSLWDLDDATFAEVVQPVIDGVRSLPDPERRRPRIESHNHFVCERPAGRRTSVRRHGNG